MSEEVTDHDIHLYGEAVRFANKIDADLVREHGIIVATELTEMILTYGPEIYNRGGGWNHEGLAPLRGREECEKVAARLEPYRTDWDEAFGGAGEEVEWLAEPVIERGAVTALYSNAGVGKSLLSLEMALNIIRDGGSVLYLDAENTVQNTVERLKAMGADPGELGRLHRYSTSEFPALDSELGGKILFRTAEKAGADLIIIDTTMRMITGGENDADTFHSLSTYTLMRLKDAKIAVLRLDHAGKDASRGQRGSSAKGTAEDMVWQLTEEQTPFGPKLKLTCEKDRSGHSPVKEIELERHSDPVLWHELKIPGQSSLDTLVKALDRLQAPDSISNRDARKLLTDNGVTAGNVTLAEAVRLRKARAKAGK